MLGPLIDQRLTVACVDFHLHGEGITIVDGGVFDGTPKPTIYLTPVDRHHANQLSIALRMASKRLEEVGKRMG